MSTSGLRESERLLDIDELGRQRELFLSMLCHDLRNPLSTIQIGLELLRSNWQLDDRQHLLLERLHGSARRMARMIDQLLDFERCRLSGGIPLVRCRVDLGELCAEVIAEFAAAGDCSVPLERLGDTTGEWDRDRLAEVISNLVGNAIAHGERNTAAVIVDGRSDQLVMSCRNEGPPIAAEVRPHLFDPFRGGRLRSARASGIGLGLYIVARIVEEHGGRITVSSTASEGTTFAVHLPRLSVIHSAIE
jgi:sigma-B regulation protein RsbU (phosphoserine phosphatase)